MSESELDWLDKFSSEYYGASFQKDGNDIQDYKTYGKDSNDRNNARNRDLYGHLKNKGNKFGKGKLVHYHDEHDSDTYVDELSKSTEILTISPENAYIDFIEFKEIEAMLKEYDNAMSQFSEVSELWPQWQPALLLPSEPLEPSNLIE